MTTWQHEYRLGRRYFRVVAAVYEEGVHDQYLLVDITHRRLLLSAKLQVNKRIAKVDLLWGQREGSFEWPWTESWATDLTRPSAMSMQSRATRRAHQRTRRWSHVGRI